ncbi:hypothetical protein CGSSp18BS74_08205 [Streptococcus pneumoniae SP18-BS74]|nr:hypothetical protein CGSSp18BS74_08205 [Streptococcus pneumoniae SP18-BS74]
MKLFKKMMQVVLNVIKLVI